MNLSILITTNNRIDELKQTLAVNSELFNNEKIEVIIYDDGCTDGTFSYVKENHPQIKLLRNKKQKGLIYCRNILLNTTKAEYAISLDDDAHFLNRDTPELIEEYFKHNPACGLISCRIIWSKENTAYIEHSETPHRVIDYVGCGHVWRMEAWRAIPDYPEWYIFYGEEDFASSQLFKNQIEIHYVPDLFVQHRVDMQVRKNNGDSEIRMRRSLRAGWFNYFTFLPFSTAFKGLLSSLKNKGKRIFKKGEWLWLKILALALADLIKNSPRIKDARNPFTKSEFALRKNIPKTTMYWKP